MPAVNQEVLEEGSALLDPQTIGEPDLNRDEEDKREEFKYDPNDLHSSIPLTESKVLLHSDSQGDILDRALGCVYGCLIGDAGANNLEKFNDISLQDVEQALNLTNHQNSLTDVSEMALALLKGLQSCCEGYIDLDEIFQAYQEWMKSGPSVGATTQNALDPKNYLPGQGAREVFKKVSKDNRKSMSNGCLMRIAPFANNILIRRRTELDCETQLPQKLTYCYCIVAVALTMVLQ